ncbi:MAG: carboxylesterase/lipase family protein [Gemmatimonadaceae bacterium]
MITSTLRLTCLVALTVTGFAGYQQSAPRARTENGTVQGVVDSASGILVFRGIPYAAPPVADLRWRAPRPAANWSGVRDASKLGHNCMQHQPYDDIDPFTAGVSEDCLYLNVWTSSLTPKVKRPVMVWIHGGGFWAGFGGEERHNGAPLAKKGAVVVTLNYRLGAFGFLAHPALAGSSRDPIGNFGLLDQIAALKWVKHNIARFGGDPNRVTIFGESAGGMSVGSLIASPLAKGLFQRAILESGTGVSGLGVFTRDTAQAIATKFVDSLHLTGSGADLARQLRGADAKDVLNASLHLGPAYSPRFFPVVDGTVLPHAVDTALMNGTANLVPVIVGTNRDEGDEWMAAPSRAFARLVTSHNVPAYLYIFSRVGADSVNQKRGAYHSAEITFVFGRPTPLQPSAGTTSYDATVADAMSDYWVAFASSANPNAAPARGKWPMWPKYDPKTDALLEIGADIGARTNFKRAVYDSLDAIARSRGRLRPD